MPLHVVDGTPAARDPQRMSNVYHGHRTSSPHPFSLFCTNARLFACSQFAALPGRIIFIPFQLVVGKRKSSLSPLSLGGCGGIWLTPLSDTKPSILQRTPCIVSRFKLAMHAPPLLSERSSTPTTTHRLNVRWRIRELNSVATPDAATRGTAADPLTSGYRGTRTVVSPPSSSFPLLPSPPLLALLLLRRRRSFMANVQRDTQDKDKEAASRSPTTEGTGSFCDGDYDCECDGAGESTTATSGKVRRVPPSLFSCRLSPIASDTGS